MIHPRLKSPAGRLAASAARRWVLVLSMALFAFGGGWARLAPAQVPESYDLLTDDAIPYELDPNAPGLNRAERIRRQEQLIRLKQQQARERRQEAARERALQNRERVMEARRNAGADAGASIGVMGVGGAAPAEPAAPTAARRPARRDIEAEPARRPAFERTDRPFPPAVLYLSPATIAATVGERFLTDLMLLNLNGASIDTIELVVDYPSDVVEPVAVHHTPLQDEIVGQPELLIDRDLGVLTYRASLAEPLVGLNPRLLSIQWEPLKSADFIELALQAGDLDSGAYQNGIDLTRNEYGPGGLLVGSSVRVLPREGRDTGPWRIVGDGASGAGAPILIESAGFEPESRRQDDPLSAGPPFVPAGAEPRLGVTYRRAPFYEPGEFVVFDFILDNPGAALLDELQLMLSYDPKVLEFVDVDRTNPVTRGINLFDGPFADRWGWNRYMDNEIDPEQGLINYHVGSVEPVSGSGVVARAIARVRRPAEGPLVEWIRGDQLSAQLADAVVHSVGSRGAAAPVSGVFLFGQNLVRDPGQMVAGMEAASIDRDDYGRIEDSAELDRIMDPGFGNRRRVRAVLRQAPGPSEPNPREEWPPRYP